MSHLSTIIGRVKRDAERCDFDSPRFEQDLINLMEYVEAWTDYTPEEKEEAIRLFGELRSNLDVTKSQVPSHRMRIGQAFEIHDRLLKGIEQDPAVRFVRTTLVLGQYECLMCKTLFYLNEEDRNDLNVPIAFCPNGCGEEAKMVRVFKTNIFDSKEVG